MKIEDYELLLKLYEIGTIRGTAQTILRSQPAVSKRLKFIEHYFGEQIFVRTPKQLLLTSSGEVILEHAKQVIVREGEVFDALSQQSDYVQGTLSLACSTLISQRYLPAILADYTDQYPKVSIDLVTGMSEDIKDNQQDYHVSIIRGNRLEGSQCDLLLQDPLYIFDTEPFSKQEMKERPLISFKSDDDMNKLVDHWLTQQHYIKPLKQLYVDQIETCKQFMIEGLGMAVLPESVSRSLRSSYPHMPLKLNGEHIKRDTWLCYDKRALELSQVKIFISHVKDHRFNKEIK